ncbi:MAG: aminotransferase class I/II-fold pyridoxal phosphate-dependent enzyme [Clostridia bacterium]|nr:aminotransferase class I/II-fold pyridoxal phosphate-dependent enzyme [Clostridia bacterium]
MIDYNKVLSDTALSMKPSGIRRFFDIANTMEGVISLGVGEPDFRTPYKIRKTAIRTLERGSTRYTSNKGLDELCREIVNYSDRKYNIKYDPTSEVLVTVGGSEAIDMAVRAMVNAGDEVIIPEPSYVCYQPIVRLAGGVPVVINTRAENDFKLTASELRAAITPRTKAVILPYPSNPTGAIMEREDLIALSEVLLGTDILVISDEIYSELTFGGVGHTSPASIDSLRERTVVINGFSKAFSMTGWRLGYALAPAPIIAQMTKLHQYAIMCAPTTSQYAAVTALRDCEGEVAEMLSEYDARRRIIVDGFRSLGLECREPKGAFYAFPSIASTGMTSEEFCEKLLYSKRVALVPGTAFGESGEGFVRASYCYSLAHIKEALRRIGEFLEEIKK